MLQSVEWLLLVASLPTAQSAVRMRLWRALRSCGAAGLRDGVWLLPLDDSHGKTLRALAEEVRAAGGSAEVLQAAADGAQDAAFRKLFDRGDDYARLMQRITAAIAARDPKAAHALRREFKAIAATDYFPGPAREQIEAALADLAAAVDGEPRAAAGDIRRLASADFQARRWATRRNPWVDRMASAWLIRRFIDQQAQFLWLADPRDCPADALGFDFDGAAFTHVGTRVTFEVLAASFGLDSDPALARIGAIVHCLDVGGVPVAEAAGVEAVLAGLRAAAANDDQLLDAAGRVFDGLHENFNDNYRQENTP
jgi:hypothetical protein